MTSPRTLRHVFVSAAVLLTLFAVLNVSEARSATTEEGGILVQEAESTPAEVKRSWTKEDFEEAEPLDVKPTPEAAFDIPDLPEAGLSAKAGDFVVNNPARLPLSVHGKVFFRKPDGVYSCSGTLVTSRLANALFTAGHCVFDADTKTFVTDFIFLPGFNQGSALGGYPATTMATTRKWARKGSFSGDIAMVSLAGTPVRDLGGSRPVNFNAKVKRKKVTLFGYPGQPAPQFDGVRLYGCHSRIVARDNNYGRPFPLAATPCHMAQGASGGGWILNKFLVSVNSYIYCDTTPRLCGYSFGPYFGKAAKRLFALPAVGGSIDPAVVIVKHPKRKTSKRRVRFVFAGLGSTPLKYRCKFDGRRWQKCGKRTSISRLRKGRHKLLVKAYDQMGRRTVNTARFRFKVRR